MGYWLDVYYFGLWKKNEILCFNGIECNYIYKIFLYYLIFYYYKIKFELIRYYKEKKK